MGLTDAPKQLNITDVYPEGTPFIIIRAWVEGVVTTQYGDRTMGKVVAQPVGGGAGSSQEFSVWGSLCEQVQSVDPAELPIAVTVKKDGKRFLFAAAEGVDAGAVAGEKSLEEEIPDAAAATAAVQDSFPDVEPVNGAGAPPAGGAPQA